MATPAALKVLVVTIVHDPADARIHRREIGALLDAGAQITYAAPFGAYGREPDARLRTIDLPRALGRRRIRAVRAARKLLRREAASHDVVLLHDPELLLAVGRAHRQTAVVWDVHEDTAAALGLKAWLPEPLRPAVAAVVGRVEAWAERNVHLILAETSYNERFAGTHPVVGNTVPVPDQEPPPPGDDRVVYVGRITRARGGAEMIELGRMLSELPKPVTVDLFGPIDKDLAEEAEAAQRAGWIRAHGFVPNQRALAQLPGALAGISLLHDEPNYRHSKPTKIMEYMAYGLPVISTPNPSSAELVSEHQGGVLVSFGRSAAEAAAIVAGLQADPAQRAMFGSAGREAAVKFFDWRINAEIFVNQLRTWASERPRA